MQKFSGFYKLTVEERLRALAEFLDNEELATLKNTGALDLKLADRMIENVVGVMHLPMAVATNFKINGNDVLIPMALEEPSVVAAACKAAKLCQPEGFKAEADESIMIGQVQLVGIADSSKAKKILDAKKEQLIKIAMEAYNGNPDHWGGVTGIEFKELKTSRGNMIICDVSIDVKDMMGANTINTILETMAPVLEKHSGGKTRLKILTNLAVKRKVRATATWKAETLGAEAIEAILDGYEFAARDVYRCTTHNKGIMNGIDAVAIACGQDWRAIEAGAHSFAAIGGYHCLTRFEKDTKGNLVGSIELPMAVGIFGGAIRTSPTAKIALKILKAKNSKDLAMAMACVGLANNFAAIYALSTTGIQTGHMKLHAKNIAVLVGAKSPEEIDKISDELVSANNYSSDFAKETLKKIRK